MSCGAKGPLSLDFAGKVTVEGMRNSKGHKICPSTRLYTVVHKKSLSLQYPHSLPTYTSYTTAYGKCMPQVRSPPNPRLAARGRLKITKPAAAVPISPTAAATSRRCRAELDAWCQFDCLDASRAAPKYDAKRWECASSAVQQRGAYCGSRALDRARVARQRAGLQARHAACMAASAADGSAVCSLSCADSLGPLHCAQSQLRANHLATDAALGSGGNGGGDDDDNGGGRTTASSIASRHSVAFAFLIKDGEQYLERNLRTLMEVGATFRSFRIVFVENDSTDGTRALLRSAMERHPRVVSGAMLDGVSAASSLGLCQFGKINCLERVRLLVRLRQRALRLALGWRACDAVVMLDFDFVEMMPLQLVRAYAAGTLANASAVFARSVYTTRHGWLATYDLSAVQLPGQIAGRRHKKDYKQTLHEQRQLMHSQCLVEVQSAFGGVGIYWADALRSAGAQYRQASWIDGPEHVQFNLLLYRHFGAGAPRRQRRPMYLDTRFTPMYKWADDELHWLRHEDGILRTWRSNRNMSDMWAKARRFPFELRSSQRKLCPKLPAAVAAVEAEAGGSRGGLLICNLSFAFGEPPAFSELQALDAAMARAGRWLGFLRHHRLVPNATATGPRIEAAVMREYKREWSFRSGPAALRRARRSKMSLPSSKSLRDDLGPTRTTSPHTHHTYT